MRETPVIPEEYGGLRTRTLLQVGAAGPERQAASSYAANTSGETPASALQEALHSGLDRLAAELAALPAEDRQALLEALGEGRDT
jgi:hypothetical protein